MEKFDRSQYADEKKNINLALNYMLDKFNQIYDKYYRLATSGSWDGENPNTFINNQLKTMKEQIDIFKNDKESINKYMEKVENEWSQM